MSYATPHDFLPLDEYDDDCDTLTCSRSLRYTLDAPALYRFHATRHDAAPRPLLGTKGRAARSTKP